MDQGIGVVGGCAADPINAYVTAVERQSVGLENVVDLVEAPREKGLIWQRVGDGCCLDLRKETSTAG